MLIVIDGPEKAGKTSTITSLVSELNKLGIPAGSFHWSAKTVVPDDRVHSPVLKEHAEDLNKVWVWDRGWPSEYVYGRLLGRSSHRMTEDPWVGEWLHGRAVQSTGLRVILAGPHPWVLSKRRSADDLDVNPAVEQALYIEYGNKFGWDVYQAGDGTDNDYSVILQRILFKFLDVKKSTVSPASWCGPLNAETVFISDGQYASLIPGGWLPFSDEHTSQVGRVLGLDAFKAAWTVAGSYDPELLRGRRTIITCGKIAHKWFMDERKEKTGQKVIRFPSLLQVYRYANKRTTANKSAIERVLQALVPL